MHARGLRADYDGSPGLDQHSMTPQTTTLTDLPPELLDHIATYLPTAESVSNLGRANKILHAFVEKDAWQTFSRTRFPSLHPSQASSPGVLHKDVARTLTTLSRAWDCRAFLSRYIEPRGNIRSFPGGQRVERWKRPRGQTIGFIPRVDSYEQVGSHWRERREVLAFSAGAEVCVREKRIKRGDRAAGGDGGETVGWMTFRSPSAREGRDDVTSLHLLRPQAGGEGDDERGGIELITGTANGDLQLLNLPNGPGADVSQTPFATQGLAVRSSSLLQMPWEPTLLAANLGDLRICLYEVEAKGPQVAPTSQIDIRPPMKINGHSRGYRAWSTSFLSSSHLAVGLGPSENPIHVYAVTPFGLEKEPLRTFALQDTLDRIESESTPVGNTATSSIYPIIPLPPDSATGSQHGGNVFLTGAYDGLIRLHDLRSNQNVERIYEDPTDSNAIYSLLPRGQERLVAGTSKHSLLKVFDLRMGAKCYSYLDATSTATSDVTGQKNGAGAERAVEGGEVGKDWNLFLKPHSATYPGRGGGNNWARRSAESSIYALASPSPASPSLYAGVENAVVEMAFTSLMDAHPDPAFNFKPNAEGVRVKEVLNLAMYDQTADSIKLMTQKGLWEMSKAKNVSVPWVPDSKAVGLEGLDERWRVGGS